MSARFGTPLVPFVSLRRMWKTDYDGCLICGVTRFLYDGERINDGDTPDSLQMEDGDSIDVMIERA